MRVALDTNRYVDLCKGVAETVALLEEADAIMLPFVVVGGLWAGFALVVGEDDAHAILQEKPPELPLADSTHVLCNPQFST